MTQDTATPLGRMTRRGLITGAAASAATVAAAPAQAGIFSFLRRRGDVRRLKMYNPRNAETIDLVYWVDGDYIRPAVKEISYFMRDWRQDTAIRIDTRTLDIMAAAHRLMETDEPYTLLSGYRSPKTNAMLRRRSRGVAKRSLHMSGKAADLRLGTRSVNQMARAAKACRGGGVGTYYGSDFVHMDCGNVRSWSG